MKVRLAGKVIALSLALSSTVVIACGYCVEDRIAAVYDHALAQRTRVLKHEMIFFAWDGPLTRSEVSKQKIMTLGAAVPGVDPGSLRVSMEPAALALAFDPQRSSGPSIEAALQTKLRLMKLSIVRLQAPASLQ